MGADLSGYSVRQLRDELVDRIEPDKTYAPPVTNHGLGMVVAILIHVDGRTTYADLNCHVLDAIPHGPVMGGHPTACAIQIGQQIAGAYRTQ